MRFPICIVALLIFLVSVLALPPPSLARAEENSPLTNAERIARGLPPKAPTVRTAVNPKRSPSPPHQTPGGPSGLCGCIKVWENTTFIGYLRCSTECYADIHDTKHNCTEFSFDPRKNHDGREPFDLEFKGGKNPFAGAYVVKGHGELGPHSNTVAYFEAVKYTRPYYHAESASDAVTEASIWHYNHTSHGLTPTWINHSGHAVNTSIVGSLPKHELYFTGDVDAYRKEFGKKDTTGNLRLEFVS